jgi:dihydroxy-acid dehydratase
LGDKVQAGDVVVIRYEGPKGGRECRKCYTDLVHQIGKTRQSLCPDYDGRFSGGTSGLSIGHISPEAAAGGAIALIEDNDVIEIDILGRKINLMVSDEELAQRRAKEEAKAKMPLRLPGATVK